MDYKIKSIEEIEGILDQLGTIHQSIFQLLAESKLGFQSVETEQLRNTLWAEVVQRTLFSSSEDIKLEIINITEKLTIKDCLYILATCYLYTKPLVAIQAFITRIDFEWRPFIKWEREREQILGSSKDAETGEKQKSSYEPMIFSDEINFNFQSFFHSQYKACLKRKKWNVTESYIGLKGDLGIDTDIQPETLCSSRDVNNNFSDWSDSFDDLGPSYWELKNR